MSRDIIDNPNKPDYLATVFDSSPVALVSLDTRLRIIMFNRAAQELTGFKCNEIIGRRINALIPRKRIRLIIQAMQRKRDGSIEGYITKINASDCEEVPVHLTVSPLIDKNGELLGVALIISDLREVKRMQSKLLESERLAAINETAISINHEINNPLCSILGNTQLLLMEKDRLDEKAVKKLRSIEREIARIQLIAERLSRITRPVLKEYVGGRNMLDVEGSEVDE